MKNLTLIKTSQIRHLAQVSFLVKARENVSLSAEEKLNLTERSIAHPTKRS